MGADRKPYDTLAMLYDLSNILDRERFKRRTGLMWKKSAVVELTEKTGRTCSQNRYLHLIIGYLAAETGNTIDYVKEHFYKRAANGALYVREKDDPILGHVEWLRSSSDLSKEEMTLSIERFRTWASQAAGIYLPSSDEKSFLDMIELELDRQRRWL